MENREYSILIKEAKAAYDRFDAAAKAQAKAAAAAEAKAKAAAVEAEAKTAALIEGLNNATANWWTPSTRAIQFLLLVLPLRMAKKGIQGHGVAYHYIVESLKHETYEVGEKKVPLMSGRDRKLLTSRKYVDAVISLSKKYQRLALRNYKEETLWIVSEAPIAELLKSRRK